MNGSGGQPEKQVPEQHLTVIKFRNGKKIAYPRLVNQLLRFPATNKHEDEPDVLKSVLLLLRSSAQVGDQAVIIVWGILNPHNWGFSHSH
ncbi:MAG: hypothetical protein HF976_00240 [ANME-2 cluster archaeon]|nr:hypothetical protein [ANME-2 cluster archaeon]MBC2699845.1 hypothetical protein [ANME-2 cluster archaeon]MBC2708266.1 hypothetical protein [ANME-2 cluster archaeon]MBC2747242.1 hypothetical protein [ANME-2 cluster archaeon]MBC2763253.1 hypothetical protein [ANME-2 cluster archaeon]